MKIAKVHGREKKKIENDYLHFNMMTYINKI